MLANWCLSAIKICWVATDQAGCVPNRKRHAKPQMVCNTAKTGQICAGAAWPTVPPWLMVWASGTIWRRAMILVRMIVGSITAMDFLHPLSPATATKSRRNPPHRAAFLGGRTSVMHVYQIFARRHVYAQTALVGDPGIEPGTSRLGRVTVSCRTLQHVAHWSWGIAKGVGGVKAKCGRRVRILACHARCCNAMVCVQK